MGGRADNEPAGSYLWVAMRWDLQWEVLSLQGWWWSGPGDSLHSASESVLPGVQRHREPVLRSRGQPSGSSQ